MLQIDHVGPLGAAAWSPDGSRILTAGRDGSAKIWEAKSGRVIHDLDGTWAALEAVAWSPDADEVAARAGEEILIWDAHTGALLEGADRWSPGDRWISGATAPDDAGRALLAALSEAGADTSVAAWAPDGERLMTGASNRSGTIWDAETGRALREMGGVIDPVWGVEWLEDGLLTAHGRGGALLWARETGHPRPNPVLPVEFMSALDRSPDGALFLVGDTEGPAQILDAHTNEALHTFSRHLGAAVAVSWSRSGERVVTGGEDGQIRVWDAESGALQKILEPDVGAITDVAWSSRGARIAAGGADGTVQILGLQKSDVLTTLEGAEGAITSLSWAPDRGQLVAGSDDGTARIWAGGTGELLHTLRAEGVPVSEVGWSANGHWIATGDAGGTVRIWRAEDATQAHELNESTAAVTALQWAAHGTHLAVGDAEGRVRTWDGRRDRFHHTLGAHDGPVAGLAWAPHGRHLLSAGEDGRARLWGTVRARPLALDYTHPTSLTDAAWSPDGDQIALSATDGSGQLLASEGGAPDVALDGHPGPTQAVAWSPDGARAATGGDDGAIRIWDTIDRSLIAAMSGHEGAVRSLSWAPDGRELVSASDDGTVRVWSASGGAALRVLTDHEAGVLAVTNSPDGRHLASGASDGSARIWDAETGASIAELPPHEGPVESLAFSPDGALLATAGDSHHVHVWDIAAGELRHSLEDPRDPLHSLAWSPDGRFLLTGGGPAHIWDAETGALLCNIVALHDGGWIALDEGGRFDTDGGEAAAHWRIGDEVVELEQLQTRYYDPHLLSKHLGTSEEPLLDVTTLSALEPAPGVEIQEPRVGETVFQVTVENRGGGIGEILIRLNGSDITADVRRPTSDPDVERLTLKIDAADFPYYDPGADNHLEIEAFNAGGYLAARGLDRARPSEEDRGPSEPPEIWGLIVGVHDYRGTELDLHFPGKDAQAMHAALELSANHLFGEENTHIQLLSTEEGDDPPTRENLDAAFAQLAQAEPWDVILVYLAGHGVSYDDGSGEDYYYLTNDFGAFEEIEDPASRASRTVSGKEIQEKILASPAGKRVLILDTCHSGQLIATLGASGRSASGSRARAIERMNDRTGTYVLAGAAADAVSYETTRYGQGVLTYSLLEGMRGAALQGENVDVSSLFQHARERVPQLAQGIGGIQKPVLKEPGSGSFDIGLLSTEAREQIPLQQEKPILVRTGFFKVGEVLADPLNLSAAVDARLNVASYEEDPSSVFFDVEEYPGAYHLSGQYLIGGAGVTIVATLSLGEDIVAGFELDDSSVEDPAIPAAALVWAVSDWFEQRDPSALFGTEVGQVQVMNPEDIVAVTENLLGEETVELPKAIRWLMRDGPCLDGVNRTDLSIAIGTARLSYNRGNLARFEEAFHEAEAALACLDEPITSEDVNALHRVHALRVWSEGGGDESLPYLSASHPMRAEYELAEVRKDEGREDEYAVLAANRASLLSYRLETGATLRPSARGELSLNGQSNALQLPTNAPYVFQRASSRRVYETTYVAPGAPLPAYPRLRRRLLIIGSGATLTSVGLALGASYTQSIFNDDTIQHTDAELDQLTTLNHVLFGGSLGAASIATTSFISLGASFVR